MLRYLPVLVPFCILSSSVAAQTASTTTRSGIYSREQATRGQTVYMGMCKNCHTPEAYTQPAFTAKWNGKSLSELYSFIREQMPKNEPGSLTPEEYADVMAYLLRINRMAAGTTDLPTEPADTKSIRIDLKPTAVRKDP